MKKAISLLLALVICLSLCACGNSNSNATNPPETQAPINEEPADEKKMFALIRASFNQRRKTLANGLNNFPQISLSKEQIQECIVELGVPVTVRGEALSLEQFAAVSNIIEAKISREKT